MDDSVGTSEGEAGSRKSLPQRASYLYSRAARDDTETELQEIKARISSQSKSNFLLGCDVRYLDGRIALLIANRMALHEQNDMAHACEDQDLPQRAVPHDRRMQTYSNMFFLLQSEPRYIANLCRLVSLGDMDMLLQTVMFTLYGNQYEEREEHLLLAMFQSVLAARFERATDSHSLLRANTPESRMMTMYTRRPPGQSYLKQALSQHLYAINSQSNLNLEVDVHKVYDELVAARRLPADVPPDQVGMLPAVQQLVQVRSARLCSLATDLLDTVIQSLPLIPYGLRWICKQIRSLTRRRDPGASDFARCSLIGAFFFLRFLNPAIVSPQAYMLVDEAPSGHPRRTLTLIAKMLQALVNNSSYSKDNVLASLRPFFDTNRDKVCTFLHAMCNVGDFYDTLELDQYMALSKKDLSINISLNELYQMHSLVYKNLDALAPNATDHLRILIAELGPAPDTVPRSENYNLELPLFNRWETQIQDWTSKLILESDMTQHDVLYMEAKSIVVKLIRSLPYAPRSPLQLEGVIRTAQHSGDSVLVEKGNRVAAMLQELVALRMVDAQNAYIPLSDEIQAELEFLGNSRDEIAKELESLRAVLSSISKQNVYLRSQLDTYKSYLQNARITSGSNKESISTAPLGVVSVGGKDLRRSRLFSGNHAHKYTYQQLERELLFEETLIPQDRRPQIYFQFLSPTPGTFLISLHYKGRAEPILEMDLKLDDLLEKQREGARELDFKYVQMNIQRLHNLLHRLYAKPRRW